MTPLRPGLLVLAVTFPLLAGCFNGTPTNDGLRLTASLPPGLTLQGGIAVDYTESRIVWSWRGLATEHVIPPQVDLEQTGPPFVEATFDVPAGLGFLAAVRLLPEPAYQDMDVELRDLSGDVLCEGDDACGGQVAALPAGGRMTVRIISRYAEPPGQAFEAHVTLQLPIVREPLVLTPGTPEPHVVVAITDSGINPYHTDFYRPERTAHPCTYVAGYPCDVPALDLSIGVYDDFGLARAADDAVWDAVTPGTWYWIPRTNLIGVACGEAPVAGPTCILDDHLHGTAVASALLHRNPDALLLMADARETGIPLILGSGLPVDLHSYSHGPTPGDLVVNASLQGSSCHEAMRGTYFDPDRLFVLAAGNFPFGGSPTAIADCFSGNPYAITVGGAYEDQSENWGTRTPDFVAPLCYDAAQHDSITGRVSYCGTSFSAPMVAGTLSRALLETRRHSGYTGSAQGDVLDPLQGLTRHELRDAVNATATYAPNGNSSGGPIPLLTPAPWVQWGWGFVDESTWEAMVRQLEGAPVEAKPLAAEHWMAAQYAARLALWGR